MPPDYRNISRKFDRLIKKGDEKSALNIAFEAIQEFDTERDYTNSINLIEKVISSVKNKILISRLISHLIMRALLSGDQLKTKEFGDKLDKCEETSMSKILKSILNSQMEEKNVEYILESIEFQNIFGNFETIESVPFLQFKNEDEAFEMLEDNYDYGRYIVHLIQTTTHFQNSISHTISKSLDCNITEKRRILKLE